MNDTHQTFQAGRRINTQADEQTEPQLAPAKIVAQGQSEYIEEPDEEFIEDEDGELARMRYEENKADEWASREYDGSY